MEIKLNLRTKFSAHKVGACRLEVSRGGDGNVITQPVIFDYKVNPNKDSAEKEKEDCEAAAAVDDRVELKNTLLQKLEMLCDKMRAMDGGVEVLETSKQPQSGGGDVMEDVLVSLVDKLTQKSWKADAAGELLDNPTTIPEFMTQKYRGMTLLHLAASLGYSRLTSALLRWSADNPVLTLQTEIDALAQDSEGFTPLVSALS